MQSSSQLKPFSCPFHPSEEIQRVCLDLDSEHSLQCIECILQTKHNLSKDKFCPLADFVNYAVDQYKTVQHTRSFREPPPSSLVDLLAYEDAKTKALNQHIEREKQKVEENFNFLLQEFTLLCHSKKQEILTKLDLQVSLLKNNYAFYKSKIDKHYGGSHQEYFDKDSLINKINQCKDTQEMEILVKNLKEDMVLDDHQSKIKEDMKEFANELNRQSNTIPKPAFNGFSSRQKLLEQVKKQVEELSEIDYPITEVFGRDLCPDSKAITKAQDFALLKKWLRSSGLNPQLRLLYRASRGKFSSNDFHTKCDGHEATLTIAKSTSGHVFGGFSDQSWQATNTANDYYKTSHNSWLFSMNLKEQYPVREGQTQAIYTHPAYGPTFGSGPDLCLNLSPNGSGCSSSLGNSYENSSSSNPEEKRAWLAGSWNFDLEEIEVYAVLGKYSRFRLNSLILHPTQDLLLIRSWFSKLKEVELELIYRGSRDGFGAKDFHTFCDEQGPTMVVCKAAGSGRVFGGYTSQNWSKSGEFVSDKDAFLFSMTSSIKHPVKDHEQAIYCNGETGPIFGKGYDLFIATDSQKNAECTSVFGTTYKANVKVGDLTKYLAGEVKFSLQEIEVFKVAGKLNTIELLSKKN